MSFQQTMFRLVAELGGNNHKPVVQPMMCRFMGDLPGGVFLSQLLYWCDKGSDRDGWFYKTYAEWGEEIFLSKYEVNKAAKLCVEYGFLETSVRKANGNPTVHYRLDRDAFIALFMGFIEQQVGDSAPVEMDSQNFDERDRDPDPPSNFALSEVKNLISVNQNFDERELKISLSCTESTSETTAQNTGHKKRMNDPVSAASAKGSFIQANLSPSDRVLLSGPDMGAVPKGSQFIAESVDDPDLTAAAPLCQTDETAEYNICRTVELLTDAAIGLDEPMARKLAAVADFDTVAGQAFTWLAERNRKGKNLGTGALLYRIRNHWSHPPLTDEQKRSDLYRRFYSSLYAENAPAPVTPTPLPAPQETAESLTPLQQTWQTALKELSSHPALAEHLRGSELTVLGQSADGTTLYRVQLASADGLQWMQHQALRPITRTLSDHLHQRVCVELAV